MSEHKLKTAAVDTTDYSATTKDARVLKERSAYEHPGFFLRGAVWIVSRFPLTRNKYQNWTTARTLIVGWLLWLIVLPLIPIVAAIIWYVRDPEGFKKSPWAKALLTLAVIWAGYAGVILTNPSQANVNGKYSPLQTAPNGEIKGAETAANTVTDQTAKEKVAAQKTSNASNGKQFANCTEAFKAGVFNIKRADGSYQSKLDRDNDGIACEK